MSQARIFETMEEIKSLELKKGVLSNTCFTLEERAKELAGNVTDIESKIAEGQSRIADAEKKTKRAIKELQDSIDALEIEKTRLEVRLFSIKDQIISAEKELRPLEEQVEFLVSEKTRLEKEHVVITTKRNKDRKEIETDIARLTIEVNDLIKKNAENKEQDDQYTVSIAEKKKEAAELDFLNKKAQKTLAVLKRRIDQNYQIRKQQKQV